MSDTNTARLAYAMPSLGADMDEGSVIEWLPHARARGVLSHFTMEIDASEVQEVV